MCISVLSSSLTIKLEKDVEPENAALTSFIIYEKLDTLKLPYLKIDVSLVVPELNSEYPLRYPT